MADSSNSDIFFWMVRVTSLANTIKMSGEMWENFYVKQCRYTGGKHRKAAPMSAAFHIICHFYVCAKMYKD